MKNNSYKSRQNNNNEELVVNNNKKNNVRTVEEHLTKIDNKFEHLSQTKLTYI